MVRKRKKDERMKAKSKKERLIEQGVDKLVDTALNEEELEFNETLSPVSPYQNPRLNF